MRHASSFPFRSFKSAAFKSEYWEFNSLDSKMRKTLAVNKHINFSVDDDEVWWLEVPSKGLTVMFSVDMRDQGILFDHNDDQVVLSGSSTFAVFAETTLDKARKLLKMTGGAFEEQPKITEEILKTYSVEIENGRAWMGFENSRTRKK
jgi:hypothetical protein